MYKTCFRGSILPFAAVCVLSFQSLYAQQLPFSSTPEWTTPPLGKVSTGLGVADIDRDGWLDIVVANGNDIERQHVEIYFNNGDGTFPDEPGWQSDDIDFHGHLAIADVNSDGFPDVAATVFLGEGPPDFRTPGHVKLYMNNNGTLETTPSWRSEDSLFTFSCAFGDADGDGDLDLAVAGGQPYDIGVGPYFTEGRIYYNDGGALEVRPGWKSTNAMGALDVEFADFDRNGFLDLIFVCEKTPNYIFLANESGEISQTPSWFSDDEQYANSVAVALLDDNQYPDPVVSDNDQLGGSGKFKIYHFMTPPDWGGFPAWSSVTGGYGSAVLAEDLDNDGTIDLIAGRWFGQIFLYNNVHRSGEFSADWTSATTSTVEAFALRDLDQDGIMIHADTIEVGVQAAAGVYLNEWRVESILFVEKNGELMSRNRDYRRVPGSPWLACSDQLEFGDEIIVTYAISTDRDLVVTNWDDGVGNFLFYNHAEEFVSAEAPEEFTHRLDVYPNPFEDRVTFAVDRNAANAAELRIYDTYGREVWYSAGSGKSFTWDASSLPAGVYYYRLSQRGKLYTGRLLKSR